MTTRTIKLGKGFRLGKDGRVVKSTAHLDVSRRLQANASKRVRVVRKGQPR